MLRAFGHRVATSRRNVLGVVGSLKFDHFQTWANNTQHVATHRNRVAKRGAPNNVAICCVGMLRSFGRGFTYDTSDTMEMTKAYMCHTDDLISQIPYRELSL